MMKRQEYRRLAKISLASRKKTTANTVRGIAFGLIMLIPIIFLGLGLNNLMGKINRNAELLYANIVMATERENISDQKYAYDNSKFEWNESIVGSGHYEYIDSIEGVDKIYYEVLNNQAMNFELPNNGANQVRFNIDSKDYALEKKSADFQNFSRTSVVDLERSGGKIIGDTYVDYYVPGCDEGFSNDGKKQVIISEALLNYLGLSAEEAYGKIISIQYLDSTNEIYIDNDYVSTNNYDINIGSNFKTYRRLCKNYTIVGVIKKEVTATYANVADEHILGSSLIFTTASAKLPSGNYIEPKFTRQNYEGVGVITIGTYIDKAEYEEYSGDYLTFGVNYFSNFKASSIASRVSYYSVSHVLVCATQYQQLYDLASDIGYELRSAFSDTNTPQVSFSNAFASSTFQNFRMVYQIFTYVAVILLAIGGIIFFSAMVNLFNTIMHSVDTRRHYLGVMRAIGARNNVIPKLYLSETGTIFKRALIPIGIFGSILCVGIELFLYFLFKDVSASIGVVLTIDWYLIFVTFLIVLVVLFTLGYIFSIGCSRRIAKRKITEVLEG